MRLGCELLTSRRAKLYLLSVIEVERGLPGDKEIPPATARAEEVLQRAEEVARPYKRSVEAYVRQTRRAGVAVVREAVDKGVGTIVLGLQYKERFGSFTLGRHDSVRTRACAMPGHSLARPAFGEQHGDPVEL